MLFWLSANNWFSLSSQRDLIMALRRFNAGDKDIFFGDLQVVNSRTSIDTMAMTMIDGKTM